MKVRKGKIIKAKKLAKSSRSNEKPFLDPIDVQTKQASKGAKRKLDGPKEKLNKEEKINRNKVAPTECT